MAALRDDQLRLTGAAVRFAPVAGAGFDGTAGNGSGATVKCQSGPVASPE